MRRAQPHLLTLIASAAMLAAPSAALAATAPGGNGGSGLSGSGSGSQGSTGSQSSSGSQGSSGSTGSQTGSQSSATTSNPLVTPANGVVSATGDGITVQTLQAGLTAHQVRFTGTVPTQDVGDVIEIERRAGGGQWLATAHATAGVDGAYSVIWRANRSGTFAIEAVLEGSTPNAAPATRSAATPATGASSPSPTATPTSGGGAVSGAVTITVFRSALATIYGPGFYGQQTACGQTLQRSTLGVASRTLKCGTKVQVFWNGQTITVPVIDRGPYANGASWDLTMATARALGITGTSTVGTLT
jgi:rare lipoprotein A